MAILTINGWQADAAIAAEDLHRRLDEAVKGCKEAEDREGFSKAMAKLNDEKESILKALKREQHGSFLTAWTEMLDRSPGGVGGKNFEHVKVLRVLESVTVVAPDMKQSSGSAKKT